MCQSINQSSFLTIDASTTKVTAPFDQEIQSIVRLSPPERPSQLDHIYLKISSKNPQMSSLHLPLSANIEVLRPSRESIEKGGGETEGTGWAGI